MNSLRSDIHSAFEVIEPPLGGMPERVVQTVLADKRRRRKERMTYRLRISFALVAAVLLLAVAAAAIMTWNSLHSSNISPAGVGLTQVQQLEARPLNLPTVATASQCPESPSSPNPGFQYGTGPVYADGGQETGSNWGHYWDVIWYAAPNIGGPILVRGRDLMSDTRRVIFVGPYSAGPVVGADAAPNTGAQHTELVLDAGKPPHRDANHYGYWQIRQGMSSGWVGCVGFQIDGPHFTEIITTFAAP
ncbi:MAG TPA: hypothetical protein VFR33_04545 [Candidatus Dormibacteraeota bacterium]|nr:hypothetical protein [Candidatus Dormibacteraeota bacterium]